MGRPKKSKSTRLAQLNKKKVSAHDKTTNESNDDYVAKLNNASTFNVKSTTQNVNKLIVNDPSAEISYEKVKIPFKNKVKNAFSNISKEKSKQKLSTSNSRKRKVEKKCISGNFHQGSLERYGYFAGKQCVANSLLCIIYRKIMNFRLWNSSILDKILDLGNEYYQHLQSQPNIQNDYIMVSELIRTVEVEGKYFDLQICESSEFGVIDSKNYVAQGLFESFQTCLSTFESCFVTFNGSTFAIMKHDDNYFVFDSHSRNNFGLLSEDGCSILIEYDDMNDLYVHCLNLSVSMNSNQLEQYEITGINVIMIGVDETNDEVNGSGNMQIDDPIQSPSQLINNDTDEVVITNEESNEFVFNPISLQKRRQFCQLISLPVDKLHNVNRVDICKLKKPTKIIEITGDGNCLFRSLSFVLSLCENNHRRVRLAIVKHIKSKAELFTPLLREGYQSLDDYIKRSRMRILGSWGTEFEILAACDLLQTDIYIFTNNKWVKYPVLQITNSYSPEAIYLHHKNENHYEVVENVERDEPIVIDDNIDTQLSGKRTLFENVFTSHKSCKRKRGNKWCSSKKRTVYYQDYNVQNRKSGKTVKIYLKHVFKSRNELNKLNRRRRRLFQFSCRRYKLKQKYISHLKTVLQIKYKTKLKPKLKNKYITELKPKLKNKYITELKPKLKNKYMNELKLKLQQKYMLELRIKILNKYRFNRVYRLKLIRKGIDKYKQNVDHRIKVKKMIVKRRIAKRKDMSNIEKVIDKFRKDTSEGPIYVCSVCNRLLFKNQVKECQEELYEKKSKLVERLAKKCITKTYYHVCDNDCIETCSWSDNFKSLWICFTCNRKILQGKMPAEAVINDMDPGPLPNELKCLNQLEKHLVCKNIIFLKLVKVSPHNDKKLLGEIVSVPSNLTEMSNVLPRCKNDDEIIRIKLKKRVSNKGYYEFQTVTKNHIKNALNYLKHNNIYYSDVTLNNSWVEEQDETLEDDTPVNIESNDTLVNIESNDKSDSDNDSEDELPLIDENIGRYTCESLGGTCLQPVDATAEVLNSSDKIFCVSPSENNTPVRLLTDKTNEACSFPYLFAKGKNTFCENRDVRITLGKYLKTRLMSVDTRFASCSDYLFYGQYIYELQQIISGTSIALRQGRMGGNMITADMLTQDAPLANILKSDAGYTFMKNCRGSPAYWQATQKDLFAMLRQLGTPTFFVSFSCSELRFESFLKTILLQQGSTVKVSDLNWLQKRELLRSNPVTVARLFDQRFKLFLKNVLLSDAKPLGKISDFFYRIEFQQRGSPHVHMIIYIDQAPKLNVDSDEQVVQFIDKYISCELPDDSIDSELNEIVSNVQKHSSKHSKSCRKNKKVCRFNFPKPPSDKTFICRPLETENTTEQEEENENKKINDDNKNTLSTDQARSILESIWKELSSEDKHYESLSRLYDELGISQELFERACERLTKKTYIVLKRGVNASWINQYNTHMLRAWNANLDIQYVTDAYACVIYIVSYITKAEREMGMLLRETFKEAKQNNLDAKACMRKISTTYLHSREVSGPESAVRVLGLPLKQCSRKVQFIPTGQNNIRVTLPLKVLQSRAKDGTLSDNNLFMTSTVDRYLARPKGKPFDGMCIATFCSEYRVMSKSENANVNSEKNPAFELQHDLGFIIKRTRSPPAIVRYARFSVTKDPENYYLSSLQLFLPYRIDTQLKPPQFETHEEFYKSGHVKICEQIVSVRQIVEQNRELFQTDIDIDTIAEVVQNCGDFQDAWASIAPETEIDRIESERFRNENDIEQEDNSEPQIPDIISDKGNSDRIRSENNISGISKGDAVPLLRSLNDIQCRVFYKVRQYCLDKVHGKNPDPLRLFITGSAGTGKSHLIKCINYEASRILAKTAENLDDCSVLLTGPTGVSAFAIGASTIHSSLSIRTKFTLPYQPLGQETVNTLRCKYRNLQILVIDEISMVDHKLLCYIHGRLCQIKGTNTSNELFGNICVICFGDMWQLKPVKASSLCHETEIDIWNGNFKLIELTEIMRQKDDLAFAQLLNRIRKRKKSEEMLASDIEMLQSRVTNIEVDCLHIFSTNLQVDNYNARMITEKCPNSISIQALDYSKDARSGRMLLKDSCVKATDTPLVDTLTVGIGSNVMLVVNLDICSGLINGSFGTVTFIENDNTHISKIYVKFNNAKVGSSKRNYCLPPNVEPGSIPIERHESTHINYKGDVRRQFPLRLAYAVTIHKVQGLSLDRGVVSLDRIFQAGQAYVALSRVKTLDGLTIQDFNQKAIFCDEKIESALEEMQRFLQPEEQSLPNSYNIILFNVQGLTTHFEDFKNDKRFINSDMICLTETWLKNVRNPATVRLENFIFYNQARQDSYDDSANFKSLKETEHGGVGIYYSKNKPCSIIRLGQLNLEYVACNIPDKNVSVIVIYRPPKYRLGLLMPHLIKMLSELLESGYSYIVMGDFNENLLEGHSSIKDCFQEFGFKQCVTESTTEGNSILDHVYLSSGINLERVKITIVPTYYSYHEAVKINLL